MSIKNVKSSIDELDKESMEKTQDHLDSLTKPPGSLGKLEELCIKIAGIQASEPIINGKKIFILAGDHGITEEGVSAFPSSVTKQMMRNFVNEGAAINALSNYSGTELELVDMGVEGEINSKSIINKKMDDGTNNFYKEPAMTPEKAEKSIKNGIEIVNKYTPNVDVIGLGEMGIGNTTPSAAIFSSLLDLEPREVVGSGTGLDDEEIRHKVNVIGESLEKHNPSDDPIDVLSKVGGFEIGGLAGVILGGAANDKIVIVDGYITLAAALIAMEIEPKVRNYLVFAHRSGENGFDRILRELNAKPLLDLDMKLGEGTGASLAMNILDSAVKIYHEMATFEEAEVSNSKD